TNSCPSTNNYKFEGKERDTETGNDDFGARYYSNRFGRWLSADWSNVPVPVPYANLTNPQTLNLFAMVSDDPETSADLDGHIQLSSSGGGVGGTGIESCSWFGEGADGTTASGCGPSANVSANQADDAQQAEAAKQKAQNQTTLNLNGTNVDVTFNAAEFSNGQTGAVIDANPQGACDNCRWAQTVSRTGEDAHGARTDREPDPTSQTQPLYPGGVHKGNDAANFHDEPSSSKPGTFSAVTTLGVADKANKTFKVTGSMTWGYKIDKNGNVSGMAPRVATKAEQARSLAVLKRESPGWTISP
ncbi:MAG TPA: RHS repeat-associated core domain-containing protein, partial [Candidatus Acidoferrum sp.]